MTLNVTAMMDLEAPIVHSPMSMNANIGLVPYMQNVQTPWAVLLVRVVKVMKVMVTCANLPLKLMRCHTRRHNKFWTMLKT
jgi:hypothetical protein